MRKEFVKCASRTTAKRHCPWASRTLKVCEGYIAFESITDYQIAKNQR